MHAINAIINSLYRVFQSILAYIFSPTPPLAGKHDQKAPRIAVIGAGLTGISSAAHAIGHGFEVTIFEAGGRNNLGGIWSRVNNTSSLQIYSIMYRFHPSVKFDRKYPDRARVVEEITKLWKIYHLDERTAFDTRVERVWRDQESGKWIINDKSNGMYDGVIVAVGTCGNPKMLRIPGQETYRGEVCHSSELTGKNVTNKKILVRILYV